MLRRDCTWAQPTHRPERPLRVACGDDRSATASGPTERQCWVSDCRRSDESSCLENTRRARMEPFPRPRSKGSCRPVRPSRSRAWSRTHRWRGPRLPTEPGRCTPSLALRRKPCAIGNRVAFGIRRSFKPRGQVWRRCRPLLADPGGGWSRFGIALGLRCAQRWLG